jgi:cellulose synthase/poly-beta-1,6-N-acetylglucosamine synthase-like glycosyltransferase
MSEVVDAVLTGFNWFVLAYFLVLNSCYAVLIAVAAADTRRHRRRAPFAGLDELFASPVTPAVSVVVPAHNEEAGIVESVRAMLALKYPVHEVVVVEDGSTDDTFGVLQRAFDLEETPRVVPGDVPTIGAVESVHVPRSGERLVVVRKVGAGRKTDANNVGLNTARHPLVCFVDADALLDEEALLRVVSPFVDDPERVVATGGCIRASNGSTFYRGRIVTARMPRSWLARIQVIEYLRAFLLGRTGWSRLGGLLIISGAFGVFRRDLLVEVGGFELDTIGEDAELVARIHRTLRDQRRDYRVSFVAEPVCWTEVPESRASLASQRTRWSRGLAETLWQHRRMIGNPRYGRIGVVVMPYFLFFELLGPVLEIVGVATVLLGLAFGLVNVPFALLFFVVAIGYGTVLSFAALAVEEASYRRYPRTRDLLVGFATSVVENVGFRQLHAWWRLRGLGAAIRGREGRWVALPRTGFTQPDDVVEG